MTPPSELAAAASNGDYVVTGGLRPALAIAPTDGERLMRFARQRDEAAFRELVETHAALVWGVCWQVLRHEQDAEDAFQATFLILARRAKSIREAHSIAGWLYRVAFRTALMARTRRTRRAEEPMRDDLASADDQLEDVHRREQCLLLLEELHALPMKYRAPLALCYLEGRSRREAADELGVTAASVKGLLARGTRILRSRLVRRGVALSGAMAAASAQSVAAQAAMNPALAAKTAALGMSFAFGGACAASLSSSTAKGAAHASTILAEKGLQAMSLAMMAKPVTGLLAMCAASALALAAADGPRVGVIDASAPALTGSVAAADVGAEVDVSVDDAPAVTEMDAPPEATITAPVIDDVAVAAAPARIEPPRAGTPTVDVVVPTPAAMPTPVVAPLAEPIAPAPAGWVHVGDRSSRASLKLEVEYWTLKGRGLEQKAKVLREKAQVIAVDRESRIEAMELQAEADLMLAEVKLCEANAQRLKDALVEPEGWPASAAAQPTFPSATATSPPTAYYPPPVQPYLPQPYTAQNTWPSPQNPPTAPAAAATTYAAPPLPESRPAETKPERATQIDMLMKKLTALQEANDRMQQRIEELEASHGDGAR